MFPKKENHDCFESTDEFIDNLRRGGEIEFKYAGKKYSITHPEGNLCFIQVGNNSSEIIFDSIESLLRHKIDDHSIRDIIGEIEPYFRCF